MSTIERVDPLQAETERRTGVAYLLTTNENGSPHAVMVETRWEEGRLRAAVSGRTERNIDRQSLVSFIWPPDEPGGYTLFVDADAFMLGDGTVCATPLRGVMHRPGQPSQPDSASACGSDCVELFPAP